MEGILEQQRVLHEERERLKEQMSQEMVKKKTSHREQLNSEHRIRIMLERLTVITAKLADLYEDKDGLRRQDIAALSNSPFNEFYHRLRNLRVYYQKHPEDANSVPLSVQVAAYAKMGEGGDEDTLVAFSDEESQGRYLDLHAIYEKYLNLKGIRRIDYFTFLKIFDQLFDIPKEVKSTNGYKQYVTALLDYLTDFVRRTKPLLDLKAEIETASKEFLHKWSIGAFPGWPKNQPSTKAASANQLDIWQYKSPEDLMSAGLEKLKTALIARGMKCGGTLEERAKRLWAARGKRSDEIEESLLVKKEVLNQKSEEEKEIAALETKIYKLTELLSEIRHDTQENVQRKQARTGQEREEEDDEALDNEEEEDEDDEVIYNPKNLPLGWDGKPIPYWLYKLHGLNINYPCEICGNQIYRGPKAFQRHFSEWRHAHGMRCLGIPNTAHFANITHIEEAVKLWERLKKMKSGEKWKADAEEEFEDSVGNVVSRKTYEDLRRQGLL